MQPTQHPEGHQASQSRSYLLMDGIGARCRQRYNCQMSSHIYVAGVTHSMAPGAHSDAYSTELESSREQFGKYSVLQETVGAHLFLQNTLSVTCTRHHANKVIFISDTSVSRQRARKTPGYQEVLHMVRRKLPGCLEGQLAWEAARPAGHLHGSRPGVAARVMPVAPWGSATDRGRHEWGLDGPPQVPPYNKPPAQLLSPRRASAQPGGGGTIPQRSFRVDPFAAHYPSHPHPPLCKTRRLPQHANPCCESSKNRQASARENCKS